ncbi:gamma-soluble NSF attachment protein-like [Amphibalanus amphitrite]|uniref:gamma-soluble NSF attachment protein-like n=1 Tax=Amphibalanus amphitrite TaxID=1232801 RepID=UPI001C8FEACB|nr:gamma-soluble NSF attachment protein-like [Amphibalanus amphitrite]XP_043209122.1 gamma-soluble NSF attachment protein-like [Amphibalanus amphitrite]
MSSKKEEALSHIKEAEKHLKTSFLKWKPDLDSAADEYNKAATCYKTVRAYAECRDALSKAANCYQQNRSLFAAAKCYEQGILMSKELGDLATVVTLCERAAQLYQQHGSPESAAQCLEKAAKIVETPRPADAVPLYQRAADVVMLEDRQRTAANYVSKVCRLLVRLGRYDEAVSAALREMGYQQEMEDAAQCGRLTVVLVLLHLARDDVVAARKAFDEWGTYCEREEVATLTTLLEGYEDEDPELARRALNSSFIKHMDIDYAKLAKSLKLPEQTVNPVKEAPAASTEPAAADLPAQFGSVSVSEPAAAGQDDPGDTDAPAPAAAPAEPAAPAAAPAEPAGPADDDDEYSGGLC